MYGPFSYVIPNDHQFYVHDYDQWRRNYGTRFSHGIQINNHWKQESIQICNEEYWCETCDRGFRSKHLLDDHKKQHQKCNIDGCQFVAHPKIITKHIQMQHSSGLYKRIAKLVNPEEIRKWREERRKKYPTKCNIDKKADEMKEKINRGEKMCLKRNGSTKNSNLCIGLKRKHNFGNNKYHKQNIRKTTKRYNIKHPQSNNIQEIIPTVNENKKLKPFTGILHLVMNEDSEDCIRKSEKAQHNFLIEDDECVEDSFNQVEQTTKTVEPTVCSAISSLICNYRSSDEENDAECNINSNLNTVSKSHPLMNTEVQLDSSKITDKNVNKNKYDLNNSDSDSGPEEIRVSKDVETKTENIGNKKERINNKNANVIRQKSKNQNHNLKLGLIKQKLKLPSTLLEKLLHKEIIHERNVILQCIRHIVKNNYFD